MGSHNTPHGARWEIEFSWFDCRLSLDEERLPGTRERSVGIATVSSYQPIIDTGLASSCGISISLTNSCYISCTPSFESPGMCLLQLFTDGQLLGLSQHTTRARWEIEFSCISCHLSLESPEVALGCCSTSRNTPRPPPCLRIPNLSGGRLPGTRERSVRHRGK